MGKVSALRGSDMENEQKRGEYPEEKPPYGHGSAENARQKSHPMAMEARRIPGREATLWLWKRGECPAEKPPYGYGSAENARQKSHPMAMEARKVMSESR